MGLVKARSRPSFDPAPVTLAGRHVLLEPLRMEHTLALYEACYEDDIWRWMAGRPSGVDGYARYIRTALDEQVLGTQVPFVVFFFSSRRRHTRWNCDWSSDVCSSDLGLELAVVGVGAEANDPQLPVVRGRLRRLPGGEGDGRGEQQEKENNGIEVLVVHGMKDRKSVV